VAAGIWRDKWWQHYERGLSCAEGKFWEEAISSFRAALATARGQQDRWRVNTYGVHFLDDYFPHRELGIVYYQQGRYEEARRELELSLGMTATAKAKFYLNKVHATLLQASQRDTTPPRIILASPAEPFLTKDLRLTVSGYAEDDTYVSTLLINGHEQFVELAQPRLPFEQEVALQDGVNTIDIEATDLSGRHTRQQVLVHLDRHGPNLSLQQVELLDALPQRARLQGVLADRSPITRFNLAGREVQVPPGGEAAFSEEVVISPGTAVLPFEAEDAAGNITRGEIALASPAHPGLRQGLLAPPGRLQWAFLQPYPVVSDLVAASHPVQLAARSRSRESSSPVIELTSRDLAGGQGQCRTTGRTVVAESSILLELKVTDESDITRVAIDGQPLRHPRGMQLFFTEIMPLQLDTTNGFLLEAVDEWGNTTRCELVVKHEVRKSRQMSYRLKVLQAPFTLKERCESTVLMATAEEYLFSAFLSRKRFNFGKIARPGGEKKGSEADGVIQGTACEGKTVQGIPFMLVFADFVDADNNSSQSEEENRIREDVYGEGLDPIGLRKLMDGLSLKLVQHFPLVEGNVSEHKGKKFVTSLSKAQKIRPNMKLIVFREAGRGASTEQPGGPQEILGEAMITGVHDRFSEAALIKSGSAETIQPRDKVVTK
jgi:hypothetical protein